MKFFLRRSLQTFTRTAVNKIDPMKWKSFLNNYEELELI